MRAMMIRRFAYVLVLLMLAAACGDDYTPIDLPPDGCGGSGGEGGRGGGEPGGGECINLPCPSVPLGIQLCPLGSYWLLECPRDAVPETCVVSNAPSWICPETGELISIMVCCHLNPL